MQSALQFIGSVLGILCVLLVVIGITEGDTTYVILGVASVPAAVLFFAFARALDLLKEMRDSLRSGAQDAARAAQAAETVARRTPPPAPRFDTQTGERLSSDG